MYTSNSLQTLEPSLLMIQNEYLLICPIGQSRIYWWWHQPPNYP